MIIFDSALTLTLLIWRQKEHPAHKKMIHEVVWLSVWSKG